MLRQTAPVRCCCWLTEPRFDSAARGCAAVQALESVSMVVAVSLPEPTWRSATCCCRSHPSRKPRAPSSAPRNPGFHAVVKPLGGAVRTGRCFILGSIWAAGLRLRSPPRGPGRRQGAGAQGGTGSMLLQLDNRHPVVPAIDAISAACAAWCIIYQLGQHRSPCTLAAAHGRRSPKA